MEGAVMYIKLKRVFDDIHSKKYAVFFTVLSYGECGYCVEGDSRYDHVCKYI